MRREILAHLIVSIAVFGAMMALLAVFDQSWEYVYGWLGLALALQALSYGDFALLPLSDVDDLADSDPAVGYLKTDAIATFLSGVFVPVIAMLHAGFLDGVAGVGFGAIIMMAAVYRVAFVAQPSEPAARYMGFPAVWSVVGFYLHAFDATPFASILAIGLGIILGLMPTYWPNPLFSERWQALTRIVVAIWFATAASILWHGFPAAPLAKSVLLAIAVYGLILTALIKRSASLEA